MYGLTVYFSEVNDGDNAIYCYDGFSALIIKAMEALKLYNTRLINFADFEGADKEKLSKDINLFLSTYKDDLFVANVNISYSEFGEMDFSNITEEDAEKIENSLMRDSNMITEFGFENVILDNIEIFESFLFIYPNEVGKTMIEYLKNLKIDNKEEV